MNLDHPGSYKTGDTQDDGFGSWKSEKTLVPVMGSINLQGTIPGSKACKLSLCFVSRHTLLVVF